VTIPSDGTQGVVVNATLIRNLDTAAAPNLQPAVVGKHSGSNLLFVCFGKIVLIFSTKYLESRAFSLLEFV